jgi:flagellar hook assembly protein FlgD
VLAGGRQLNLANGEAILLTSDLMASARETLVIKDGSGTVVRVLADIQREPGSYRDSWDGLGDNGRLLPDGQYFWAAEFRFGEGSCVVDLTKDRDGDAEVKSHPEYGAWDRFDNRPLRFSHVFDRPGEITLVFARETYYVRLTCEAPQFCRFLDGLYPAREFSYEWAGVDDTGALRSDIRGIFVVSSHERLSRNGIVVHGGRPRVSEVRVNPARYSPGLGLQEVSFRLQSSASAPASAVVTFTNQESRSVLRTLRMSGIAPGVAKVPWDGRGENGALVAPGGYTIRIVVTDSLGQTATGEAATSLDY